MCRKEQGDTVLLEIFTITIASRETGRNDVSDISVRKSPTQICIPARRNEAVQASCTSLQQNGKEPVGLENGGGQMRSES